MQRRYLDVTFRKGKPLAAYLYLQRKPGDTSVRTEKREAGLLVDFAPDGQAIGIEITSSSSITLTLLNRILATVKEAQLTKREARRFATL